MFPCVIFAFEEALYSQLWLFLGLRADILRHKTMRLLHAFTLLITISCQIPILGSSRVFIPLRGRKKTKASDLWRKWRTEFVEVLFLFDIDAVLSLSTCGAGTKATDLSTCLMPHGIGFLAPWCRTFGRYFHLNPRNVGAKRDTAMSLKFGSRSPGF